MEEIKKIYNRIIIFLIIIIVLIMGIFIINKKDLGKKIKTNYILDGNIIYDVISKNGLTNQNQNLFVSSDVDSIVAQINYKFNVDKNLNLSYKYEIKSSVISSVDDSSLDNSEVYRKEEVLVSTQYKSLFNNDFSINEKVTLNYDYYNSIANEYNDSVNVPIKSKLFLTLFIYIKDENGNEEIFKPNINLNLEQSTFSIQNNSKKYSGSFYDEANNYLIIIINIVLIISILLLLCLIGYNMYKFFEYKKNHYLEFKYRKIMQDYNNIVVPIPEIPRDKETINIRVLYFKSMIDIQKELHLPILCYKSDEYVVYLIINNKLAYVYFLNNENEKI